jgi:hypothetical protein
MGSGFHAVVLNYCMGVVVENGTVFHFSTLKKICNFFLNFKIIKIIIIKNKNYKNIKKLKGWPDHPQRP